MNQYSLGTNLLVLFIVVAGCLLALPNIYGDDPALQISRTDGELVEELTLGAIGAALDQASVEHQQPETNNKRALVRFTDVESQIKAAEVVGDLLSDDAYVVAVTLAPRTPGWLRTLRLKPMSLGLDLRGGVHFVFEVDLQTGINQYLGRYAKDLQDELREARISRTVTVNGGVIRVVIANADDNDRAEDIISKVNEVDDTIAVTETSVGGQPVFTLQLTAAQIKSRQDFAIQQNIVTLRRRVDELNVAEPVVQRQGLSRIVVQLPGVQDSAGLKRIINSTATIEFRMVDPEADAFEADRRGRAPLGTLLRYEKNGAPVLLKRDVIASGDHLTDATSGYSQGQPAVFVNLNGRGADRMLDATSTNLGRPMAVLFIEQNPTVVERGGEEVIVTDRKETVISVATIQGVFSSRFQITGLTPFESQDLALLLRAGALAAPMYQVEERTIGPTLGRDNIEMGRLAIVVGFLAVVLFMALYYRVFGLIANLALFMNLVLLVALLSVIQASLTLPGMAGIVLTVGMAVDANVLIFERIREEIRNGSTPQASIKAGYEKAFSTIADANITTFIAALVLWLFGTGPVKGFAVTLSLGVATSMFTAIVGTRAVVNLIYGKRSVQSLSIGGRTSNATA
jgi:preprotein translocase subunit SecD